MEENLVISIKEKMENVSMSHCISRVSERNSKANETQYYPMLVSIGPFHHGNETLKSMEDKKWSYLNTLLSRNPNSNVEQNLDECVKRLRHFERKARKCYTETIPMEKDKFVETMLIDGCFIIELFLKFAIKGLRRRDDPWFNPDDRFVQLTLDLMLLENQIPFFILEQLFNIVPIPKQCSQSLTQLALHFFEKLIPGVAVTYRDRIFPNVHHLLDLIRQCHLPTNPEQSPKVGGKELKSATDLQAAGIKFKSSIAESLLNIAFTDGVLEIPFLKIHTYAEILFRNIIELEHCCSQYTKLITSYVFFMKCLIQSKNDVKLLRRKGIIRRDKQDEILDLFKKLNVYDLNMEDFHFRGLCAKINSHQNMNFQLSSLCCN